MSSGWKVSVEAMPTAVAVPARAAARKVVQSGPPVDSMEPVVQGEFERVEALELLGMTLAHLNDAEERAEMSPRVPLLLAVRDKLALALREEM